MKIRGGFVLAFALGLGLSGCAAGGGAGPTATTTPVGGAGTVLAQGERPRETNDTREAERSLEAAAAAEATNAAEAGVQYQQALQSAQAAIAADATNPLAHRLAGLASLGLEDYDASAQHFDRAQELRPIYELELAAVREQAFIDLYQEASPFLEQAAYEQAAAVLENAQTMYPDRPEALITLAQLYAQMRNHDLALERIEQATAFFASDRITEVDAETAAAWQEQAATLPMMRGQVLVDAGRFEEALPIYQQMADANPADLTVTQDLAVILMQMGRTDEALGVYSSLMGRPGLASQDLYRIGIGFYQASDYTRAAEAFGRSVEASRMDRDALEMWARSLQLDSAYTAVPAVAERWIALDPASQIGITVLAQAVNATGDAQRAGEIIRGVEALPVTVGDLELRRLVEGGAQVSGSVTNRTLAPGSNVTLTFTFYSESGAQVGTATQRVTVGTPAMAEVFQLDFSSTEAVGGYGYQLTTG
jgi:tetratricopeptide (TPR) repeat protein